MRLSNDIIKHLESVCSADETTLDWIIRLLMLILIRFNGDITTKAKETRRHFLHALAHNIESALGSAGLVYKLRRQWSRFFVETPYERALDVLSRVFGINSLSVVRSSSAGTLDEVVRSGEEIFRDLVKGKRFAVRARRSGQFPFGSQDVERALGAALLPYARRVDLSDPEVTAQVELRNDKAYYFTESLRGPGGLPLTTAGRAVALASGGFDSAVAAWMMLKRGVQLDFIFCRLGGAAHEQGALRVLKFLSERWCHGYRPQLHSIDFEPLVNELQTKTEERYWQVLLKRLMMRVAERVAAEQSALGIVTGEAIGQVSSQTLANLGTISQVTQWPILRPLLGYDKQEIMDLARRIGTYELSATVKEYCALTLHHPATRVGVRTIEGQEAKLDRTLLHRALAGRRVMDLKAIDPEALAPAGLQVEEIPSGAAVIDLREERAYQHWHYPGAQRMDFFSALKNVSGFDRDKTYVFYCELGLKSGHLAEYLQQLGYRTFNFKDGLRGLMRYAAAQDLIPPELLPSSMIFESP
jgi:thiamine biosynthesis protein ThiI